MSSRASALILAAVAAVTLSSTVEAAPANLTKPTGGWVYFNKPGADMRAAEAQMTTCAIAVYGWKPGGSEMAQAGLLLGAVGGGMQKGFLRASQEHCMVLRGWRVVRVPEAEGEALSKLQADALAEVLKPWVGSTEPHGEVVRVWSNEAAKADTVIRAFMPSAGARPSLNALAASKAAIASVPRPPQAPSPFDRPQRAILRKSIPPADLAKATPDSAVIVFTLSNSAPTDWTRLNLQRLGPNFETPAYKDGRPDLILMSIKARPSGGSKGDPVSRTFSFVVPPGRWAVESISDMLSLCLGAPFVDVKAGDVLNLGTLDFGRDGRPIDMSPEPASAHLATQPALAKHLRPAVWANGATFPCLNYAYAMEYPNAPFQDGYVRGGTASQ